MNRYMFTLKVGVERVSVDSFVEMLSHGTEKDPLGLTDIDSKSGHRDLEVLEQMKDRATIIGALGPYIVGSEFPLSLEELNDFLRSCYRKNTLEKFLSTCGLAKALGGGLAV